MSFADLKNKNEKELQALLQEKQQELVALRFKASERQLKAVRKIRSVRQTIAQILTLLNNKSTHTAQQ